MTDVRRHVRNQHNRDVEKCSRCCLFFMTHQDLESHENSNTCTREGVQKGLGQERLWKALYAAIYPGKPIPETPYYPLGRHCPPPHKSISPSKARGVTKPTEPPTAIDKAHQHRQAIIHLIDILRNNLVAKDINDLAREETMMMNLLHSLPHLIKQTGPHAAVATPPLQPQNQAQGSAISEENIADVSSFQGQLSFFSGMETVDRESGGLTGFSFEPTNESFNDLHFPDLQFEDL